MSRIKILVASRSEAAADAVAAKLRDHGRFIVSKRVVVNGHTDPLHDVSSRPDLLVLHHVPGYGELEYLATLNPQQRPKLLVFGPAGDASAMRLAMRAGASDYLPEPLTEADLLNSLNHIAEELAQKSGGAGKLVTVINSKGGAGTSFVASNLAGILAKDESQRTTLVDLDLQFGGLARYLDLSPERGLVEALEAIDEMDQASKEAFLTTHDSGLKVLAAPSDRPVNQQHIPSDRIDLLLHIFLQHSDFVLIDLPRYIDPMSTTVLERSDRILVVVQQTLAYINGAAKLLHVLSSELGVSRDYIDVVINRFDKNSVIELDDIRKTLRVENVHVIPNQFKLVAECIDTGKLVSEVARVSAVGKALRDLAVKVRGGDVEDTRRSFFGRTFPNLLGPN